MGFMEKKERIYISLILLAIAIMVLTDLLTDSSEGVSPWHLLFEGGMGLGALTGIFYLFRGSAHLKHQLEDKAIEIAALQQEAQAWRDSSRKYIEGLSSAITQQLDKWQLTAAEKEVAFLLLKGLSLKEIAEVRNTGEKTARTQSLNIYSKSGLSGRSELSAFFLEELLPPQ